MQCDSDEYSLLYFSFLAGRLRAGSVLWTEDWFGDDKASEWSYLGSRLRSAARLGGVRSGAKGGDDNAVGWGGYIVPRGPTSGVARGGGCIECVDTFVVSDKYICFPRTHAAVVVVVWSPRARM